MQNINNYRFRIEKTNLLFNLISQQPDIENIYIYIYIYMYVYIYRETETQREIH